jgi:hypothetical protein
MWPVRPNESIEQTPFSYNVYWDDLATGTFTKLLVNVSNSSQNAFNLRSYHNKVVIHLVPSQIAGWNNDKTNYVRLKAVVGGVEQNFEEIVAIPPYSTNGMRLHYPELRPTAIIGFNSDEQRFIPVSVDTNGKIITTN